MDADVVWRALAGGADPAALGLGRTGGRWDLRSLPAPSLPWSRRDPLPHVRRVTFRGLDLSGTDLPSFRFTDCRFVDCVFDGAALADWRLWSTSVQDCSFRGASLAGAGMGGDRRHPTTWQGVDLSGADLRDTAHHAETYLDCTFRDARLTRVDFAGSRHVRSRFAGRLDEVEFRAAPRGRDRSRTPNTMDGVDLRAATVRFGTFSGLDLSRCLLPTAPDHLRFDDRRVFAARVLDRADGIDRANVSLRITMVGHLRDAPAGGGGPGFQHRLDLGETPAEVDSAVALLRSCGAR